MTSKWKKWGVLTHLARVGTHILSLFPFSSLLPDLPSTSFPADVMVMRTRARRQKAPKVFPCDARPQLELSKQLQILSAAHEWSSHRTTWEPCSHWVSPMDGWFMDDVTVRPVRAHSSLPICHSFTYFIILAYSAHLQHALPPGTIVSQHTLRILLLSCELLI